MIVMEPLAATTNLKKAAKSLTLDTNPLNEHWPIKAQHGPTPKRVRRRPGSAPKDSFQTGFVSRMVLVDLELVMIKRCRQFLSEVGFRLPKNVMVLLRRVQLVTVWAPQSSRKGRGLVKSHLTKSILD